MTPISTLTGVCVCNVYFQNSDYLFFLENGKLRVSTSNLMVDCRKSYVEYEAG